MHTENEIIARLNRVDWNFPGSTTSDVSIHSLHWFPGNYIPQIPSYMIQLLSDPGDLVCDPFCGSGTTGVEALYLDRNIILSDINQVSIHVTNAKLAAVHSPAVQEFLVRLVTELMWESILKSPNFGRNGEGKSDELKHWYHPDTLLQLNYLWNLVESTERLESRRVLEMVFTDTLFDCAAARGTATATGGRRRHHWGWVADNVLPKPPHRHNAIRLFRKRLVHAIDVLQMPQPNMPLKLESLVIRSDVRRLPIASQSVDLIVTSPPYLCMIDYALANRLTYLWMNWPLQEDRNAEIGARFTRHRQSAFNEYLTAMDEACCHIGRVLRKGGYCAIVIGASAKYSSAAKSAIELFEKRLRLVWGPTPRSSSRRRLSARTGRTPTEWVCVFRKES